MAQVILDDFVGTANQALNAGGYHSFTGGPWYQSGGAGTTIPTLDTSGMGARQTATFTNTATVYEADATALPATADASCEITVYFAPGGTTTGKIWQFWEIMRANNLYFGIENDSWNSSQPNVNVNYICIDNGTQKFKIQCGASGTPTFDAGHTYRLRMDAVGSSVKCYVSKDNATYVLVGSVTVASLTNGYASWFQLNNEATPADNTAIQYRKYDLYDYSTNPLPNAMVWDTPNLTSASISWLQARGGVPTYTYTLKRSLSAGMGSPTTLLSASTATTYAESGLTAGTTYYYQLTVTDSASNTSVSSVYPITPLIGEPSSLDWTQVSGVTYDNTIIFGTPTQGPNEFVNHSLANFATIAQAANAGVALATTPATIVSNKLVITANSGASASGGRLISTKTLPLVGSQMFGIKINAMGYASLAAASGKNDQIYVGMYDNNLGVQIGVGYNHALGTLTTYIKSGSNADSTMGYNASSSNYSTGTLTIPWEINTHGDTWLWLSFAGCQMALAKQETTDPLPVFLASQNITNVGSSVGNINYQPVSKWGGAGLSPVIEYWGDSSKTCIVSDIWVGLTGPMGWVSNTGAVKFLDGTPVQMDGGISTVFNSTINVGLVQNGGTDYLTSAAAMIGKYNSVTKTVKMVSALVATRTVSGALWFVIDANVGRPTLDPNDFTKGYYQGSAYGNSADIGVANIVDVSFGVFNWSTLLTQGSVNTVNLATNTLIPHATNSTYDPDMFLDTSANAITPLTPYGIMRLGLSLIGTRVVAAGAPSMYTAPFNPNIAFNGSTAAWALQTLTGSGGVEGASVDWYGAPLFSFATGANPYVTNYTPAGAAPPGGQNYNSQSVPTIGAPPHAAVGQVKGLSNPALGQLFMVSWGTNSPFVLTATQTLTAYSAPEYSPSSSGATGNFFNFF